jgi:hypothetical protein
MSAATRGSPRAGVYLQVAVRLEPTTSALQERFAVAGIRAATPSLLCFRGVSVRAPAMAHTRSQVNVAIMLPRQGSTGSPRAMQPFAGVPGVI